MSFVEARYRQLLAITEAAGDNVRLYENSGTDVYTFQYVMSCGQNDDSL
jgi:hypothetical protein